MSSPQIKCPDCKTSMNYTAAACPNCKRRMVATAGNPNSGSGVQPVGRGAMFGGLIAGGIIFVLILFCCSSSNKNQTTYDEQRAIEMKPVRDEMQRKMNEGKSKEQAAQEIVDEETMRQIIKEQQNKK